MDLTNINKNRKRKSGVDLSTMVYGKIPPQAKEVEEAVLGVLLIEPAKILDVRMVLKADDFYVDAHQKIYKAICDTDDKGITIDIVSVVEQLRNNETLEAVGGAYYVIRLTNTVVSGVNVLHHSRLIKQYSIARKLISFSGQVISDAYDDVDPLQLLTEAEQLFFEINKDIEETRVVSTETIAWNLVKKIIDPPVLSPEEIEDKYLYTGMRDWDHINGMLFGGGVYVIAARPAMGKTAHAVQLLINLSKKYPVGLINVEMTDEQLAKRIVSNMMEMDNYIFKKKSEDWSLEEKELFAQGLEEFLKLKLHIESNTPDIDQIIRKIRFWVKKFGVRAVVIDYLQILRVAEELQKYMTDVQALNYILEKIRACAKELEIPIFLLSQLNREIYRRAGNKEPNLGDLKGSGKIEEIAFQISFLHRPEYYDPDGQTDEMGESIKGLCYQIVAKHRDGELGRIKFRFLGKYSMFAEWQSELNLYIPMEDTPF